MWLAVRVKDEPGSAGADRVRFKDEVGWAVEHEQQGAAQQSAAELGHYLPSDRTNTLCAPRGSPCAALRDHTYASMEYPPADECVKTEPSCSASEWTYLYAEHAVKDELVLGPECVQRPRARVAPGESFYPSESAAETARALAVGAGPARKPRGSRRTPRGCSARLHRRVPPSRARGSNREAPARVHVDSDMEDELYTMIDYDKDPVCDLCGRRFARRADLMRHVVHHIHTPTGTELEKGSDGGEDDDLPRFLWHWARLVPRECRVRLERCATHQQRPPSAGRDAPPQTRETFLHNVENTYVCEICKRRFTHKRYLNLHIKMHSPNISQVIHKSSHRINGAYACKCKKEFSKLRYLVTHLRTHTGGKPHACDICNKRFYKTDLNRHRRTHTGEQPFSCEICNRKFNQLGNLRRHKSTVHEDVLHSLLKGTQPQSCEICNKPYVNSSVLHIHKRIHTGVKPYFCDVCKQRFTQSSDLNAHKRIHTGEKPFPCEICNKRFRKLTDLYRHKRIHMGEKPHCCKQCGKKFNRLYLLTQHIRKSTGEKPFSCKKIKPKRGRRRKRRTSCLESCVSERDYMDGKNWNDEKTLDRDLLKRENCCHKQGGGQVDDETNPQVTNG